MSRTDKESLALLAKAGIVGEDAKTALATLNKLLAAGRADFGADAGRAAAVLGY